MSRRTTLVASGVILAAVVCLVFLPAVTHTFGFADDFPYLGESTSQTKWMVDLETRAGRPVAGLLRESALAVAGTISNLAYLRLATIAMIATFGCLVWRSLVRGGVPNLAALGIALIVSTVPPLGIYAGWAVLFAYAPPLLLTFVCSRWIDDAASAQGARRGWRLAASMLVQMTAYAMYPPATGMLWLWFSVSVLTRAERSTHQLRRLAWTAGVFAASLAAYFVLYRASGLEHARAHVTTQPVGKLVWFVQDVLPWVARLQWFPIGASSPIGLVLPLLVVALSVTAFFCWRRHSRRDRVVALSVWLVTLPLAHFPMLIVAEHDITERSLVALSCVIALAAAVGLWRLTRLIAGDRWASVTVVLLSLFAAWQQFANTHQFVRRQAAEYDFIREAIDARGPDVTRAVMIQPAASDPLGPNVPIEEYQLITSVQALEYHQLGAMTVLISRELGRPLAGVTELPHGQPATPAPDEVVVRMDPLADRLRKER